MNRGTPARPKLYCEQFDVEPWTPTPCEPDDCGSNSNDQSNPGELRGLCCNCENRQHCTIAKVEEDVWHCEEYC
jgi:hypothetical protein